MTDSNKTPFNLPHDLELAMSTSSCSLDVSVLSADSSCSSFGSISQVTNQQSKPLKKVHRKRQSFAKFNQYKAPGRWHNPVDAFGSVGMNTAPYRKSSFNRLSNPKLQRMMALDVALNVPCRKCSRDSLAVHANSIQDGPASFPNRNDSNDSVVSDNSGKRATAALNFHFHSSSKATNKNFEWNSSTHSSSSSTGSSRGSQDLNSRTVPSLLESVFHFEPPSSKDSKKRPPSLPERKASMMEFNILNAFECTCPDKQPKKPAQPVTMMPPPIPARKESLMDFDDVASVDDDNSMPPPSMNSSWNPMPQRKNSLQSMTSATEPVASDPVANDSSRRRPSDHWFMAMPPITRFERSTSEASRQSLSPPPRPTRRGSAIQQVPALMTMPMPFFDRQCSSASAPSVPQRRESYMDINDIP